MLYSLEKIYILELLDENIPAFWYPLPSAY